MSNDINPKRTYSVYEMVLALIILACLAIHLAALTVKWFFIDLWRSVRRGRR